VILEQKIGREPPEVFDGLFWDCTSWLLGATRFGYAAVIGGIFYCENSTLCYSTFQEPFVGTFRSPLSIRSRTSSKYSPPSAFTCPPTS
jgi:hypothetical protein